jgi:hypothetical protein
MIHFPVTDDEMRRIIAAPAIDLIAQARNNPLRRIIRDLIPDQEAPNAQ